MKKTLSLLAICLYLCTPSQAQDTITNCRPKDNYLVMYDWWCQSNEIWNYSSPQYGGYGDNALYFYTPDTLVVYGIAGGIMARDYLYNAIGQPDLFGLPPLDTSHNVSESMRLYEYDAEQNTLHQIGEDLTVNVMTTPVTYYQQMTQRAHCAIGEDDAYLPPLPVYEMYFSTPQKVVDSFYVGITTESTKTEMVGEDERFLKMPVVVAAFEAYDRSMPRMKLACQQGTPVSWFFPQPVIGEYDYFIFPILTPASVDTTTTTDTTATGDTTGRGGDTLGVTSSNMANRMVAVMPNPAKGQVKVACGMGLTLVEVFDASGKQVHSQKSSGMVVNFNVSKWTKGVYTVVATTPMGKVTKKLIVE